MKVEPVNIAFEAEIARIAGPRRKGESVDQHLHRISRVRQMQRAEEALLRADGLVVQAVADFPTRLAAHRADRGLSIRELGRRAEVSFATVSRIENGENYMVSSLVALAAYLDSES